MYSVKYTWSTIYIICSTVVDMNDMVVQVVPIWQNCANVVQKKYVAVRSFIKRKKSI